MKSDRRHISERMPPLSPSSQWNVRNSESVHADTIAWPKSTGYSFTRGRKAFKAPIFILLLFGLIGLSFFDSRKLISSVFDKTVNDRKRSPLTSIPIHQNSSQSVFDPDESISSLSITNSSKEENTTNQTPWTNIPINRNSTYVRSDISKIVHIPSETRIEIHLNSARKCQNPLFQGRISGLSLSMIEFRNVSNNVVVGDYDLFHIPKSGQYYVEILVVLCEKYGDGYRSMNLRGEPCLQIQTDDTHQLTTGNGTAAIDISLSTQENVSDKKGRWLHKSLLSENVQPPQPLFTPVEADGIWCRNKENKAFCQRLSSDRRKPIFDYTFRWQPGPDVILNKPALSGMLPVKPQNTTIAANEHRMHICFLGASHSRELKKGCESVLLETKKLAQRQNLDASLVEGLTCSHVDAKFPFLDGYPSDLAFNETTIVRMEEMNCTHVVVGLFQWYFSYENKWRTNLTFNEWKSAMTKVARAFRDASSSTIRRVFFRSAHPNGFSHRHIKCPQDDSRTPLNAKVATQTLFEIANEIPVVSVLDTTFLMDAIWDSARDWSHYRDHNRIIETQFVLSQILREEQEHAERF